MASDIANLTDTRAREWELLDRARRDSALHPANSEPEPEKTIVTISRDYGVDAHKIAEHVRQRLGHEWQLWDREIVEAVAHNAKVRSELAANFDDRLLSKQERVLRYLTNYWRFAPDSYYHHLLEVLVSLSHQGRKIIVGRGANFVLSSALKIRLYGSEAYRAEHVARRDEISLESALARVRQIDKDRRDFISAFFGRDIDDPTAYDIGLRMDHLSAETAVATISSAVIQHTNLTLQTRESMLK